MPLPPALAARLKKRGLLPKTKPQTTAPEEEVIAENYDTPIITDALHDEFGQPLPPKWEKIFEQKFRTWYYWDTVTNRVSWLPPSDPEHKLTFSENKNPAPAVATIEAAPKLIQLPPAPAKESRKPKKTYHGVGSLGGGRQKRKKAAADDEFDPMDPSSYSDAPKGSWTTGLKQLDDAKSGVDSTANGPLFQQRPYPSPGEVLSRNKKARRELGPMKPR